MTELIHGLRSTYNNHKCRCDLCRAANTSYWKTTRHAKKVRKECLNCSDKVCKRSKTFCEFHRLMHNEQSSRHNRSVNARKKETADNSAAETGSGRQVQDVAVVDQGDEAGGGEGGT